MKSAGGPFGAPWLRAASGLNVVADARTLRDWEDTPVTIRADTMPVREFLDQMKYTADELDWCLAQEVVWIGYADHLPESLELRFYQIEPILGAVDGYDKGPEDLISLIMELTVDAQHTWDMQGRWIQEWNGLALINQTPGVHAEIESFLNRLLNDGAREDESAGAWRKQMDAVLAQRTTVSAEETPVVEIAAALSARHGVQVWVMEEAADETVSLVLADVSLRTALEWIARAIEVNVVVDPSTIRLSHDWPTSTLEFYDLSELYERVPGSDVEDVQVTLEDLVRNYIDPESWDATPDFQIHYWGDQMLVSQQAETHPEIAALVDAFTRAFGE
ncbi:MAG: hypothetical protein GY711_27515 [bacterium]|nr:hypothetical protein [bacterium]